MQITLTLDIPGPPPATEEDAKKMLRDLMDATALAVCSQGANVKLGVVFAGNPDSTEPGSLRKVEARR